MTLYTYIVIENAVMSDKRCKISNERVLYTFPVRFTPI